MKKSELRQIIKEEIQNLNEATEYQDFDDFVKEAIERVKDEFPNTDKISLQDVEDQVVKKMIKKSPSKNPLLDTVMNMIASELERMGYYTD